ncbi:hypothetical protein EVAR_87363_1 [Eumeta japonica]|uniref:Uncharacterized protein n=1 Tax=Eumeta variegata TaxID=151549 RepID=A0A4C1Y279_EUMVA|nr:hypothetical protein EVAR_87363_1 [Eumeta japonica]
MPYGAAEWRAAGGGRRSRKCLIVSARLFRVELLAELAENGAETGRREIMNEIKSNVDSIARRGRGRRRSAAVGSWPRSVHRLFLAYVKSNYSPRPESVKWSSPR